MKKTFIVLMLLILSSYLYADHWSTYNDISLSGSYPRFAAKGSYVSFMGYASDQDKRTDSNNYQYIVNDTFSYSSNTSNWNLGFSDLTNIMQSSSQSGTGFSTYYYAQLPNNISCGDYTSTITVNDIASMGPNDTGSRNDPEATKTVTTTIIDLGLSYNAQSTYTYNNTTYDLILCPLNNDDDDNDGTIDNQDNSVSGENDLVPITITVNPKNDATSQYCKVKFTLSGCKLFLNNNRSSEITNNTEYNMSSLEEGSNNYHKTVYAEPTYGMGSVSVMLYSNYQTPTGELFVGSNAGVTKTVYIAPSSVNISDTSGNDAQEMTEPGSVLGLTDDLITPTKMLSLSYSVNSAITNYNIKINKSNNNVKLFYYTYENYTQTEHEITNNTVFQKGSIPTSITAKGYDTGSTVITATLNITEIDNNTQTINNFHSDSLLINVVKADITLQHLTDAMETVSPGFVMGLNKTNEIFFDLENVNSNYQGYKATLQVPNNIELYVDNTYTTTASRTYTIGTDTLPTTLYMKGISGTSGTLSYLFNNPSNALIHKDSVLINVIYCDLAVDSNNDGTLNQTLNGNDDSIEETSPGMYIPNNTDDDDYDGIVDNLDDTMTGMGDTDLKELRLQAYIFNNYMGGTNPYTGYYVKLSYSNNLKLFGSRSKKTQNYINGNITYTDTEVQSNTTWTVGTDTPPTTLYIEGLSNGLGYIEYAVYDTNNTEIFKDTVLITVEPIIDTVEFITPGTNQSVGGVIPVKIKRTQRYGNSTGVLKVKEENSHINDADHPMVDWVNMPTNEYGSFVTESITQNPENRTTETVYRYKWNTLTTPMPQGVYMYNQTHNGGHTLRYEQSIGALPKINHDLAVNLNNLTISTNNDIIVWKGLDENNDPIETPSITLTVNDNDTTDPYDITVTIYHTGAEYSGTTNYNNQSQWTPVKTITLTNQTGPTQTITWDGSLDSGVASQNALSHANWTDQYEELVEANNGNPIGVTVPTPTTAEPWTYTYDITVTQTDTETYTFPNEQNPITWSASDNTWLRSKYLTIQRAKDSNNKYIYEAEFVDAVYPDEEDLEEGDDYIVQEEYYSRFYTLKDSLNTNASSITVLPFDTELNSMTSLENTFNCTHNEGSCDYGRLATYSGVTHEITMGVESVNYNIPFIFPLVINDNHSNKYRSHLNKSNLVLNGNGKVKQNLYIWIDGLSIGSKSSFKYYFDFSTITLYFNSIGIHPYIMPVTLGEVNNQGIRKPSATQVQIFNSKYKIKNRHCVVGFNNGILPRGKTTTYQGDASRPFCITIKNDIDFCNIFNKTKRTNLLCHELSHVCSDNNSFVGDCNVDNCVFYQTIGYNWDNLLYNNINNKYYPWHSLDEINSILKVMRK